MEGKRDGKLNQDSQMVQDFTFNDSGESGLGDNKDSHLSEDKQNIDKASTYRASNYQLRRYTFLSFNLRQTFTSASTAAVIATWSSKKLTESATHLVHLQSIV